jgi:hypothetical protein
MKTKRRKKIKNLKDVLIQQASVGLKTKEEFTIQQKNDKMDRVSNL